MRLNCPRCGLTITPRADWLTVEHCPRCLARARLAVTLLASPLTPDQLYATGTPPAAGTIEHPAGRSTATT